MCVLVRLCVHIHKYAALFVEAEYRDATLYKKKLRQLVTAFIPGYIYIYIYIYICMCVCVYIYIYI